MSTAPNGEFHFILTKKTDRNGDFYLFGGLQFLNAVLFIRPEPAAPGEVQRWRAILKPYVPKTNNQETEDSAAWDDDSVAPSPHAKDKRK